MSKRLTKSDWLQHGFKVLESAGHQHLKADKMVKELGVSRGSFYWHFADLREFLDILMASYRTAAVERIAEALKAWPADPVNQAQSIKALLETDRNLYPAIYQWSLEDTEAKNSLDQVDRLKRRYIQHLLLGAGIGLETAEQRSILLVSAHAGLVLSKDRALEQIDTLIEHMVKICLSDN